MNKHFKEVITHRALDFKLSGCPGILFEQKDIPEVQFKNVCAPIPLELDREFEDITSLLNISKREFLTMALSSAIDDAKQVVKDVDIFEHETPAQVSLSGLIHLSDEEELRFADMSDSDRVAFLSEKLAKNQQVIEKVD